jgi:hypothetical protein
MQFDSFSLGARHLFQKLVLFFYVKLLLKNTEISIYTGVPELADQIYSAFSLVITESNSV